jgi:beta-lactam-binding protein with PASTA domain
VVIGSVIVSVVAVVGLVTALIVINGDGDKDDPSGRGRATASERASGVSGHKGPDTSKTIEKTKCTEPSTSYNDADQILLPSFQFKNLSSVKECLQAAGWQYDVVRTDENTYGEDTVMDQYPAADTDVDPEKMPKIKLTVSTGDPA